MCVERTWSILSSDANGDSIRWCREGRISVREKYADHYEVCVLVRVRVLVK
jgi:hypothetical protein